MNYFILLCWIGIWGQQLYSATSFYDACWKNHGIVFSEPPYWVCSNLTDHHEILQACQISQAIDIVVEDSLVYCVY